MRVGKLDEAEAKARQAQHMNVVPPVTSDRAESVLHEIAMARANKGHETIAYNPVKQPSSDPIVTAEGSQRRPKRPSMGSAEAPSDSMSVVAEREANALLEKGDQAGAAAKFAEAGRLDGSEVGKARLLLRRASS